MSLNLPNNATEIEQRQKTDVQRKLTTSNPFLKNSWLGALITGIANRIYDFYLQLSILLLQVFWDTSTGDFLRRQASWFGFTENAATKSEGNVVATGTLGSIVDTSSIYNSSDGIEYEVLSDTEIENHVISILSINRSGSIATVVTNEPHGMASNVLVTILGAVQTEYNVVDSVIQVISTTSFSYEVSGAPATPATGTITLSADFGSVPIRSLDFQSSEVDVNLIADSVVSLQTPLAGVDSDANADASGIDGGTAQETDDEFRDRFIDGVQNPTAMFNVQAIKDQCKLVAGVTRVFVKEITPEIGQVTVYFVRDNDDSIIPSSGEVDDVKAKLLEIKPAHTSEDDVIVAAPGTEVTNYTFTALTPDTASMRESIAESLVQFYKESTEVGVTINQDAYRAAIFSTIDVETGQQVQTFVLSSPVADIIPSANELPILGTVTYAI